MKSHECGITILLLIGIYAVIHEIKLFQEHKKKLLKAHEVHLFDGINEELEKIKDDVRNEIVKKLTNEIVPKILIELENDFTANQKTDIGMKYAFKYDLRDEIQKNITREIREEIKQEFPTIAQKLTVQGYYDEPKYPQNLCSKDKNLPPGQKVIAYTVFGTRKIYYEGIPLALQEAVASSLYHDWNIRIYHDALVTPEIIASYKDYPNLHFCDARNLPKYGNQTHILGKFWRNIPIADPTVDVFCSRDLDSALLSREEDAVRDWLNSTKLMHTMRDFPMHDVGMLAGMWCFRPKLNRTLSIQFIDTLLERAKSYKLRTDQPLLNEVIWDNMNMSDVVQHDSFHCQKYGGIAFPTQRLDNMEFVGCPGHVCNWKDMMKCPKECRPTNHQDWDYC